jgi:hypothetical protein
MLSNLIYYFKDKDSPSIAVHTCPLCDVDDINEDL